ncbi:DUF2490 domain-containing protein [Polaribacter aestuariivivens]|uniref:DUF2490 domain-containing protein n=1 Tax=Polaribacter aestuariivivens TaxID=2304626 RepID=UPI003F492733
MKSFLTSLITFFIGFSLFGQSDFNLGLLPKVVVGKKLSDQTKWVNSIESRTIIYDEDYQFSHSLVDVSSILSFKINTNQSVNFGYIIRFEDSEIIHRTFQHYNVVSSFSSLKLGHRFAFEQFYQTQKQTTFRTRYRASLEKPLNGERVDVSEFYIKIGNEYLYDFDEDDLEIRFTPYLGYQATKKDKVEFGLDYRLSNFLNNETENRLWIRATWYISL